MENLWQQFDFKVAIMIFVAYFLIDAMYAFYTLSVVRKKAITSSTVGALMHFLLAFGVINYVQNYLYVIPLALGSWLGTYFIVSSEKNK